MSFITCENLVKIYKVADIEVFALQGLDLTIERGECTAIIGASGSGKSTLMNVLGGLDRPSAGKAVVDGQDLLKLNDVQLDRYRRDKVGFVWQQVSRNLLPYMTAQENVETPMLLSGRGHRKERARELLAADRLAFHVEAGSERGPLEPGRPGDGHHGGGAVPRGRATESGRGTRPW